jgi:hypothetical protein
MGNWYVLEEKNITRSLINFVNFSFHKCLRYIYKILVIHLLQCNITSGYFDENMSLLCISQNPNCKESQTLCSLTPKIQSK